MQRNSLALFILSATLGSGVSLAQGANRAFLIPIRPVNLGRHIVETVNRPMPKPVFLGDASHDPTAPENMPEAVVLNVGLRASGPLKQVPILDTMAFPEFDKFDPSLSVRPPAPVKVNMPSGQSSNDPDTCPRLLYGILHNRKALAAKGCYY